GVKRYIPPEARVLVHQIWPGNRRDDAAAATYSAEDLMLVQSDIGRLVQYTLDMGGGAELLEAALRIPPWEPLRMLSRDQLRRAHLDTTQELAKQAPQPPASSSTHAKSAFIYATVLEGAIRGQVNDGPVRTYTAGQSSAELPGDRHGVSANASATEPAKLLAVFVVDTNETELTIPLGK